MSLGNFNNLRSLVPVRICLCHLLNPDVSCLGLCLLRRALHCDSGNTNYVRPLTLLLLLAVLREVSLSPSFEVFLSFLLFPCLVLCNDLRILWYLLGMRRLGLSDLDVCSLWMSILPLHPVLCRLNLSCRLRRVVQK